MAEPCHSHVTKHTRVSRDAEAVVGVVVHCKLILDYENIWGEVPVVVGERARVSNQTRRK